MMKLASLILAIILLVFLGCDFDKNEFNEFSPDNSYRLIARTYDQKLIIDIHSKKGKILFYENTNINSNWWHGWSIQWINNEKFIVRSSDTGSFFYKKISDDKWRMTPANRDVSPSGEYIITAHHYDVTDKAELNIGRPTSEWGMSILHRIQTDINVENLAGSVSWVNENVILLNGDDGTHYWKKQKDGSWAKAEKQEGSHGEAIFVELPTKNNGDLNIGNVGILASIL